ncbi:hypothetical protein E3T61_15215 [Cryobacterium lactosi]|uniref:LTD domain-containing protein n=2 Tax=Cryobacterium lactosi TaxID=1259202 RepID=A0A4R9BMH8_9MICO|nr:hypothetical protein E3T61_15215 [Cryobacterium lactosi]
MTSSTKGAANDCGSPVRLNEVESSGGTPGDWVELRNNGAGTADVSGFVLKDNDDSHAVMVPAGSAISAGGYLVVDVDVAGGFGLGGADSARLFAADGSTLLDSHSWTAHAATSYGRCPDGTGDFAATTASTRGTANSCTGDLVTAAWPGSATVQTVDPAGVLGGNMSGLAYDESGESGDAGTAGDVLWAAKNGPGALYRLVSDGAGWAPDTSNGWAAGKLLHYTDGNGDVDAEGVATTAAGAEGGLYIASERNNAVSGVSRPAVLRYDTSAAGTELTASMEWNLTADLPVVGANAGLEAIAWVPDSFLVAQGMLDEHTGAAYDPAVYAGHGSGLFFVGLEANGAVYAYALDQTTGGYTRVATIASGFTGVMDLEFEASTGRFWAVCDDTCDGRSAVLQVAQSGATDGRFGVTTVYERPASMPNINNEGFALAPQSACVAGAKPVFWADDSNTGGNAIRVGSIDCTALTPTEPTPVPTPGPTGEPTPVPTAEPTPVPTDAPTPVPTTAPTGTPAPVPSGEPTPLPTAAPTPTAPVPVATAALIDSARGPVSVPAAAKPGDTVTVTVGRSLASDLVNVWLHSTPTLLASTTVTAAGTVQVVIPAGTAPGAHRIVVVAEDGTLIGWDDIRVGSETAASQIPGTLASTGANLALPGLLALLLVLAGGTVLVLRRRGATG